jgi:hypothetical protein
MRRLMVVRSLVAVTVILTMLLTVGIVAAATELVNNGGFESGLSNWIPVFGSAPESTVFRSGAGSASVTTDGDNSGVLDQCIVFSVPVNGHVSLSAWVNLNGGTASVEAYSYGNPTCDPGDESESQFFAQTADGLTSGWQEIATNTGTSAPQLLDGAESLLVRLIVTGDNDDGAYFDDVTAFAYQPTAVTLRDFSAQAQPPAAWLLPVALVVVLSGAMIMLRRRRA